jgi:hypothetical protein
MTTPPKTLSVPKPPKSILDTTIPLTFRKVEATSENRMTQKQINEREMLQILYNNIFFILRDTKWDTLFSNPDNSLTFIEIKAKLVEAQKKIAEIDERICNNKRYSGDYPK